MSLTVAWVVGGLLAAAGLVLAAWALLWDRARGRERCPNCWYDLSGAAGEAVRCPECGWGMKSRRQLSRTRRRWTPGLAGLIALAVGLGWPVSQTLNRWWEAVPTPVLFWITARRDVAAGTSTDYLRFSALRESSPGWSRAWTTSLAIGYLRDGTVQQRQLSADALQWLGPSERIVGPLADAISDPAPFVSLTALRSLTAVDPETALPHIIRIAGDPAAPVPHRREAFSLMATYRAESEAGSAACIAALGEPWMELHQDAAYALGRVVVDRPAAVRILMKVLDDDNEDMLTRSAAATGLARCGRAAEPAVPSLIRALEGREVDELVCVRALGRIGPPAVAAAARMNEIANRVRGDYAVEVQAAVLVVTGEAPDYPIALASFLRSPDAVVRANAAMAFFNLLEPGLGGQAAQLAALLNDPDERVRANVCGALGRGGPTAWFALAELRSLAKSDPAEGVRKVAARAARRIERANELRR